MPKTPVHDTTQEPVISDTLTSPPGSENERDRYIIAGVGGSWSSFVIGDIVEVVSISPTVWRNFSPEEGWDVYVKAVDKQKTWDGAEWKSDVKQLEDCSDIVNASPTANSLLIAKGTNWSSERTSRIAVGFLERAIIPNSETITIETNEEISAAGMTVNGSLVVNGSLRIF
jgi:hypothetical protein